MVIADRIYPRVMALGCIRGWHRRRARHYWRFGKADTGFRVGVPAWAGQAPIALLGKLALREVIAYFMHHDVVAALVEVPAPLAGTSAVSGGF